MTITIVSMVYNEGLYLDEWIIFHRKQGVTDFIIYDNNSNDNTISVLKENNILPIFLEDRSTPFIQQQSIILNNSLNLIKTEWALFIDVDEFVFGYNNKLSDVVKFLPNNLAAISFNEKTFGSNNLLNYSNEPVITRFTKHSATNSNYQKLLVRPKYINNFIGPHNVTLKNGELTKSPESIGFHHYPIKSKEEYRKKQQNWSDRLKWKYQHSYFINRDHNDIECLDLVKFKF